MRTMFKGSEWCIPNDFMSYAHFLRVLDLLEMTSSPGYPYLRSYPTNGDLFKVDALGVKDEKRVEMVWNMVSQRLVHRDSDYIRLFVKQEPHKSRKIRDGMLRLISSVSVIDQIIDHMIFGDFNKVMIQKHPQIPPKVGWTPFYGGHYQIPKVKWQAVDKSQWDWTVQSWLIESELDFRIYMCKNMTDQWLNLARWRYLQLFGNAKFITSSGLVLEQKHPGIMKSGCVNTISSNSIMQVILHARCCLELGIKVTPIITLGDDTLQQPVNDKRYLDLMQQFCIVKHAKICNEFAGYKFGETIEPLYKGKHAYNLLHSKPEFLEQQLDSYLLLYHESNDLEFFEKLTESLGFVSRSREYFDFLFHGITE